MGYSVEMNYLCRGLGRTLATVAVLVGTLFGGRAASADTVLTPNVPMDSQCVHHVPNGAHIDGKTGNVTVNGSLVMTIATDLSCGVRPTKSDAGH